MASRRIEVEMGGGAVASGPYVLASAGVGSCVVVTLHDRGRRMGGLTHIMLPCSAKVPPARGLFWCADTALVGLIEELRRQGAPPDALVAKVVGGARMFHTYGNGSDGIGAQNVRSVRLILDKQRVPLVAWDVDGYCGRSVEFAVDTGRLLVKALDREDREL